MSTQDRHIEELTEECPDCGYIAGRGEYREQTFEYGDPSVFLTCEVPVFTCLKCGYQWTDSVAEEIRHETVCRHLGRLTPAEIKRTRELYGLSQAEFSRITGFGEASLSRWETGIQIQNLSSDRLLRLIQSDAKNLRQLQDLTSTRNLEKIPKFRVIEITPDLKEREKKFKLRPAA